MRLYMRAIRKSYIIDILTGAIAFLYTSLLVITYDRLTTEAINEPIITDSWQFDDDDDDDDDDMMVVIVVVVMVVV